MRKITHLLLCSIRINLKIFVLAQSKEDDSSSSDSTEEFDRCPCRGHVQRHISHHRSPCNAVFNRKSDNCNSRVHISRVRNPSNQYFIKNF